MLPFCLVYRVQHGQHFFAVPAGGIPKAHDGKTGGIAIQNLVDPGRIGQGDIFSRVAHDIRHQAVGPFRDDLFALWREPIIVFL